MRCEGEVVGESTVVHALVTWPAVYVWGHKRRPGFVGISKDA